MSAIYPARFLACIGMIIQRIEGGYVNDPQDSGGQTNYGISQASYPNLDIPNITEADAIAIYFSDYWNACGAGSLPVGLDLWVFDGAINHGAGTAVKLLQQVAGVAQDGVMGPATIAAASKMAEPEVYLVARLRLYESLAGWATYQGGWTKRLFIIARGL